MTRMSPLTEDIITDTMCVLHAMACGVTVNPRVVDELLAIHHIQFPWLVERIGVVATPPGGGAVDSELWSAWMTARLKAVAARL